MKKLSPEYEIDEISLNQKLTVLGEKTTEAEPDSQEIRDKLLEAGFIVNKLEPSKPKQARFLAADSSLAKKELRFDCFWGVHAVCVYGLFDGSSHADSLVGRGSVPYKNLQYDSVTDFGQLRPYSNVDARLDAIRLATEARLLNETSGKLEQEGLKLDTILFDGSLSTLEIDEKTMEAKAATTEITKLKSNNVVGVVEDSHDTDVSKEIGLEYTNALIFDLCLKPLEYVTVDKDDFEVCYIKLPAKKMHYLFEGESVDFIARWEFKKESASKQLPALVGVWLSEDDIQHPQIYPIRLADYLTRKISVSKILSDFSRQNNMASKFRGMRKT